MKRTNVVDDIRPMSEFRTHMAELVKEMREHGRPLVLTQHGRSVAVVLSPEEYERLTYTEEFKAAVREGLRDVEEGRVIPHEQVVAELKRRFKARAAKRKAAK